MMFLCNKCYFCITFKRDKNVRLVRKILFIVEITDPCNRMLCHVLFLAKACKIVNENNVDFIFIFVTFKKLLKYPSHLSSMT